MERALGEVPHVAAAYWDWRGQWVWVRFAPGQRADPAALRRAIEKKTAYTPGALEWIAREEQLPDALR